MSLYLKLTIQEASSLWLLLTNSLFSAQQGQATKKRNQLSIRPHAHILSNTWASQSPTIGPTIRPSESATSDNALPSNIHPTHVYPPSLLVNFDCYSFAYPLIHRGVRRKHRMPICPDDVMQRILQTQTSTLSSRIQVWVLTYDH